MERRLRGAALSSFVLLASGGGCGDDALDATSAPSAEALLGGVSMADTPWPSDAFMRNGRLAITDVLIEGGQPGPLSSLAATLSELDGAPTYTSAFFPTRGDLPNGPLAGSARWVNLEAAHPDHDGKLFYRKDTHEVVALAPGGVVLAEGARYAVIVDIPLLRPSPEMRDALEGRGPLAAVYAQLAPRIVGKLPSAATIFTVGHHARVVEQMRDVAAARPAAHALVTKVYAGAAVDDFLGKPTTTRPGLGDPAGIVHDQIEAVILGTFEAPSFLSPKPPELGRVEMDGAGTPLVKGVEAIPFMLTLPKKPASGWPRVPLMIFQHGLNAGRSQVVTPANDYARAGYATIGIDALWHGNRGKIVKDEKHNFTGAAGSDGLADADDFGASIQIFDFDGDPARGVGSLDGRYVRDNFRQAIVDLAELVRFVREGDLSPIAAADPLLSGLTFDATNVVYTSESFGSVIGTGGVAIARGLRGGVLSVGGGGIFLATLPSSPQFNGLVTPLLRTTFDPAIDVSEPSVLPAEAQRSLSLLQAAIAPGDPLSFAPSIAAQGKNLLLLQARSDELIPNQATELLAVAAGATSVSLPSGSEPARFAILPTASAPYAGVSSTIAVVQLSPALHTMFTGFAGDRRYERDFPPFVPLAAPERVDNPIELAHALALAFAASLASGGPGRVEPLTR